MADASRRSPWCLFCPWSCVSCAPLVACPGLWLMLPGGRLVLARSWLMADALQVCPWLARPWLMLDALQVAPLARSDPGRGLMSPGCALARLPWLMLDALQVAPLVLVLSLAYARCLQVVAPGICPPGRVLSCAPWCLFCPWSWSDVSRLRPGSLVPGLWLMLPGGRPGACSFLAYARCAPGCALVRFVPGLWLMRSRWSPGSEIKFTTKKGRKCPDFCAFVLKLSPFFYKYLKIK